MLNLFSKFTVPGVDRVEIYQDDEDERRFYMLAGKPSFALGPDGKPLVTLIAFARDLSLMASVSEQLPSGETEGGLLTMQLELMVTQEDQKKIRDYIKAEVLTGRQRMIRPFMEGGRVQLTMARAGGVEPVLSYPTWVDGTVAFSLMPAAGPTFVKAAEGSDKPSLTGTNLANYNVMLGQEGVRLLRESLKKGALGGTLNYALSFMARIPNIYLRISGDWKNVFEEAKTHATITETQNGHVVRQFPAVASLTEFRSYFASVKIEIDKTNFPPMAGQDPAAAASANTALETMLTTMASGYITAKLTTPTFSTHEQMTAKLGTDPLQNFKSGSGPPVGGNQLWLKDWDQTMEGEFEFILEGRVAQPVSTYPNGLFYEIISPEEFSRHIIEADLNTPIFHVLEVPVRVTADFTTDPIAAIQVSVTYEQTDEKTGNVKSKAETFTFTTGTEVFYFRTTMAKQSDGAPKADYTYTSKINYKAASAAVTTPPVTTAEKSLVIGYDRLSCVRVACIAGAIPWEEVERVDVDLTYPGSKLPTGTQRITLLSGATEGSWFTYTEGNPSREYEYQLSFQLKDGPKLVQPKQRAITDRLVVDAPFNDQLDVTFVPQGMFPPIASIVLSVRYQHGEGATAYREDEVHVFTNNTETWQWKVRLPDPSARAFEYKVDITYADGSASQGEFQPGTEGTQLIGEVTSKTLEVEVVAGALDMTKWKLVIVRLNYVDPVTRAPQSETFQITPANVTSPLIWKIGLRDPAARSYTYEIQAFGADGTTKQSVPPTSREDSLLVLEV